MPSITKILHAVVKSLQKLLSYMSNCDRTLKRESSYKKVYPTQLANSKGEDEIICKVAKTLNEACDLIKFEFVTDMDGVKRFRKRK